MSSIQLDLPRPPSVNRTRKINWATMPKLREWKRQAEALRAKQPTPGDDETAEPRAGKASQGKQNEPFDIRK